MRCFISLEIPENVRGKIYDAFDKLKKSKVCYGNFVKRDNLHLTLKFLGDISEEKADEIKKALDNIDFRQFPIETGDVGFFPNEKYVRVIWLDLVASDLGFLKNEIDSQLEKLGFSRDEKNFTSHITTARIKVIKNKKEFFEKIKEIAPKKMFFIADTFSLMRSELKPQGPRYSLIKEYYMRMR